MIFALASALFAGLALLDWYAVARSDRRLETLAKPATLAALLGVAVALGAGETDAGRWLLVALAFGLLGDVFLLGDSLPRFRAGLAAFLVGHVAYVAGFVAHGLTWTGYAPWIAGFLLAAAVAFTQGVVPATYRLGGVTLAGPVAIYMLTIGTMLITAWAVDDPLVAAGATIFVASDSTLSVDRFVRPLPRGHLIVMVTYHLGQALIVAGLLT